MFVSGPRIKKFFSFYKPYRLLFIADITCAFIVMVISLFLPLFVRYITNSVISGSFSDVLGELILPAALIMLCLILIETAAALFYDYRGHQMGAMIERDMRDELFSHYQKLPFSFFDREKTGSLMSRLINDLLNLAELYHHGPEDLIIYGLRFMGALMVLTRINAGLTLAVLAFLPLMLGYSLLFQNKIRAAYKRYHEKIGDLGASLEDSLAGIRVVKSFAAEDMEEEKFRRVNEDFYRTRADIYRQEAYYFTGLEHFFGPLIMAAVVLCGGIWLSKSALDTGDFIAFLLYVNYLTAPIPQIARVIQQYQDGIAGFNRFMDILDHPPEPDRGLAALPEVKGRIEFADVSFRYNEGRDYVLEGISFSVNPGQTAALVGPSGIGKTTLCSLISRFYELSSGAIRLDGIDIRELPLKTLRRNIGVVQQDLYLFAGTVIDNIRYGRPGAAEADVIKAAKKANAHEFIMRLPGGYYSDLGPRGLSLSGGQRQRLGIARVFLKDPPVLIFDEATSALDQKSERLVHEALMELAKNRTTFIIAHRLSTVKNANRIFTLTERGLEEKDSFEGIS
ncbi:MAG: ABC transporter ATP-binding protein/permease [Treponema sp.]|jgi:ATP-binding cassette subfamily B protein|nr:ABC transporter ATP-binding protein/permease [Treponema sp.]